MPTLDLTLTAIADPTRRQILHALSEGESRVTHIAEPFAMSLNAVSKHILVLERAGLVKRRKQGREHFLTLVIQPLEEAENWIAEQRALWTWRLDRLDEALSKGEDQ